MKYSPDRSSCIISCVFNRNLWQHPSSARYFSLTKCNVEFLRLSAVMVLIFNVLALRKFCGSFSQFTCEHMGDAKQYRHWQMEKRRERERQRRQKWKKQKWERNQWSCRKSLAKPYAIQLRGAQRTATREHTHTRTFTFGIMRKLMVYRTLCCTVDPHSLRQIKVDLFYVHFDVVVAADLLLFLLVAAV